MCAIHDPQNKVEYQKEFDKKNNEIMELIFMGKIDYNLNEPDKKPKIVRQFLVRRQRSLEIMFTNGLNHWVEEIPKTEVVYPFQISDVVLSPDNYRLIVFDSVKGEDT